MNTSTEIQNSIAALAEYWLDKRDLQEEIGFDEETGDTIFSYDGYFEYEHLEARVSDFITDTNIQEVLTALKNHINNLDSDSKFSFNIALHRFITGQKLYLEQLMRDNPNLSLNQPYSNLQILESVVTGFFSNYLVRNLSTNIDSSSFLKKLQIINKMGKKEFLCWIRMPILTGLFDVQKGYSQKQLIFDAAEFFGVDIKTGYTSNVNDAIANGSYHEMIKDLIEFIEKYDDAFKIDQSSKEFPADSGINLNNIRLN